MSQPKIYSFAPLDGFDRPYSFNSLRGKVVLIVNVASLCGFTPQYKELELLYEKYHSQGLVILGFPCNQFANQEPLDNANISIFCQKNFGVTFPILKKLEVNGSGAHPLYKYLKEEKAGVLGFKGVRWNFEKFLIDRNGNVVNRFFSEMTPLSFEDQIVNLIKIEL